MIAIIWILLSLLIYFSLIYILTHLNINYSLWPHFSSSFSFTSSSSFKREHFISFNYNLKRTPNHEGTFLVIIIQIQAKKNSNSIFTTSFFHLFGFCFSFRTNYQSKVKKKSKYYHLELNCGYHYSRKKNLLSASFFIINQVWFCERSTFALLNLNQLIWNV